MSKNLIATIFSRRSIRKYTDEPVSDDDIKTMLEAAMAAPSANNSQPWHFVVVKERGTLDGLAEAHPHGKMLAQATLCIVVCGDPAISDYWEQDCSAAIENLLLAAAALGLGAVWLGAHPREKRVAFTQRILSIPENIIPVNLISIGHPAEAKDPRTQYDEARVHRERW
jgi:nitroreductase